MTSIVSEQELFRTDKPAPAGCLVVLSLRPEDYAELCRQGFVSQEVRRRGTVYYKLRFRRDGRQRVLGLGSDEKFAEGVRLELRQLQATHRSVRRLQRVICAARRLLRRSKQDLAADLADAGYRFYGYEIRRSRTGNGCQECSREARAGSKVKPEELPATL